jgi:anti-sigma regulatory factor (Ser/Thr protein kinase)
MTTASATLLRAPSSAGVARRLVDRHGAGLTAERREDIGLMVSELVTNALRHGQGTVTVRIVAGPNALTVEVADEGHGTVDITPAPGAAGGWGLRIVDELADGWGSAVGSTRVWFRVLLDRS